MSNKKRVQILKRMNYFITGIGTNIGKTLVAAILTEALEADYWKPIQAGDFNHTDSMKVAHLISNSISKVHPETYLLKTPVSPHVAAKMDNIAIDLNKIKIPITTNNLIIEGAGGLLVPLNQNELIIDLIKKLDTKVILVSQNYLGSINHTLLSLEVLKYNNIDVFGIIFNGEENKETETFILNYSNTKCLGRIKPHSIFNKEVVLSYKNQFNFL